ncbi:MAG TPA: hypothetical protein VN033_09890 [Vulgatibacter sp.]|nr:hypothetical protein [Vulgatibacter sp.]
MRARIEARGISRSHSSARGRAPRSRGIRPAGRRLIGIVAFSLVALWSGTAPAAEETWAVVGVRTSEDQGMRESVETLRGLLDGDRRDVLGEAETRVSLGLEAVDLDAIQRRIEGAELYWFQLELASARENLEQALRALSSHVGPRAAERDRLTRLLLAEIHLAQADAEAETRAAEAIEPIARLRPGEAPDPRGYSPELVALFERVRADVARMPVGWLRVECEAACPGSQVWIESAPRGAPGERIELPAGRYRVQVGDRFDEGGARSLPRIVAVDPGQELELRVDLALESAADPADGPSFAISGGSPRDAARRLAGARLPLSRLVILWMDADDRETRSFALLVEPGTGRILHEVSSSGRPREALVRLAARLLEGPSAPVAAGPDEVEAIGGTPLDRPLVAGDEREEARLEADRLLAMDPEPAAWVAPTKWTAIGLAVAAATAGVWLRLDAVSREEALLDSARSGSFRSVADGRASTREAASIRSQADLGTGLLVGAGVAAASAIVLHLVE